MPRTTVFVTCTALSDNKGAIVSNTRKREPVFQSLPGFITSRVLSELDGNKIIHHLEWKDIQSHENCVSNAIWDDNPEAQEMKRWMDEGILGVDVAVYALAD